MKQDRLDLEGVIASLTPLQLANLEDRAQLLGFPRGSWTALPAEVTVALSWAATEVADRLVLHRSEWGWNRAVDEAEITLLRENHTDQYAARPRSVRSTYARWQKAVEPPTR